MTGEVFFRPSEFACRACGATYIPAGHRELCESCWGSFIRWADSISIQDRSRTSVNRWLARRLMLEAEKLRKTGVAGRCEAVSLGPRGWIDGFDRQCRCFAMTRRDGRRVCAKHAKALAPLYVGEKAHDPYGDMERVLSDLAAVDARFRAILEAALQNSAPPKAA